MVRQLHRARIEAALLLLEKVLSGAVTSRSALVAELQSVYRERGIEPFRGLSKEGVYDKEVATVYVVGVYGAGVMDVCVRLAKPGLRVQLRRRRRSKVGKGQLVTREEAVEFFQKVLGVQVD